MSKILVKGVYEESPTDVVNKNDVDLHLSAKGYVIVVNSDGSPVGGTTSYVEDTPSAGGESMIISGVVRQDTLASSTTTDGDYAYMKVDSAGRLYVNSQGGVASGATDSGNPVKVGGVYSSTPPTYTNGQRGDLLLEARGNLRVALVGAGSANGIAAITAGSDGANNSGNGLFSWVNNSIYNGTTWDRQRGNTDVSVLASAARTTTQTSADQVNYNARGIQLVLDMTSVGTGSVTVSINGKDAVSGKYYPILTGAAVTTNSTNVYRVYPGLTAAANATVSDFLPRTFQVVVTANNGNSATYSVGYSLIL